MTELKNTEVEVELKNGEVVKATLSFAKMYKLRAKDKENYEKLNKIIMESPKDMLDFVQIIYSGYLCNQVEESADCYSLAEFLDLIKDDFGYIAQKAMELISPEKK